ncbi:MAG: AI-2E family transporter [Spirochaetia bacterium]|nr:AI-2E family transporter [Spirochaetia bacterium]
MDIKKKYNFLDISRLLPWLFLVIFTFFLVMVVIIYRSYLISLFFSIILYLIFRQYHNFLSKYLPQKENLNALLSTLFVFIAVILPLLFIAISLIKEAQIAVTHLKILLSMKNIEEFYANNLWIKDWTSIEIADLHNLQSRIVELLKGVGLVVFEKTKDILQGSLKFIINFLLSIVFLFFLFRGGEKIGEIIYQNLPFPQDMERQIGERIFGVLDAVVKGNLFVSICQGLMMGIYFWIFNLSTPVLYGSLAAFFALVPVVGTMIIWVPAVIYLYAAGYTISAFLLAGFSFGTYFLLENILKPYLLDKKLNLHPLFLFLALLGGLTEFGIKGLILGPFIVTVFLTLWEFLRIWNKEYGNIG